MSRFGLGKTSAAISLAVLLSACSQQPAQVVLKGHNFYGQSGAKNGAAPIVTAAASPRIVSATPKAKPQMTLPVLASRNETRYEPRPSYGFKPSPSTVAVREKAELAQISMKELEPITATPAPKPAAPKVLPEPQARVVAETRAIPAAPIPVAKVETAQSSSAGFIWPVKGKVISNFGPKTGGEYNDGINIIARQGEPIVAAADGEVVYSGNELRGYGNMVILRHASGMMTAYAHADRILVQKGEQVSQGAAIATVGKTGGVERAQVHFGVRKNKEPVDPMQYLGGNSFASR